MHVVDTNPRCRESQFPCWPAHPTDQAAQANTDAKLAALVDAQIRAQDEMKAMRAESREGMGELRDVVKDLGEKLDRLADIVITQITNKP